MEIPFRTDGRVRPEDEHATEPFHSFAERVLAFCNNIGHSIKNAWSASPAPTPAPVKITEPQPFKLATDELAARRGPHAVLSTEEEEEKQMKERKPFKARQLDPRVMQSAGDLGVAKVPRKPLTTPEPFNLQTEKLQKKEVVPCESSQSAAFKAKEYKKPASPRVLRSTKQVTCPLTPHFETDKRAARQPGLAL